MAIIESLPQGTPQTTSRQRAEAVVDAIRNRWVEIHAAHLATGGKIGSDSRQQRRARLRAQDKADVSAMKLAILRARRETNTAKKAAAAAAE